MMIALMKTLRNAERAKAEERDKKQMGRNAQVCFVVGAETEAIFVGMEVEGGAESL